jgi:hypothetical protein
MLVIDMKYNNNKVVVDAMDHINEIQLDILQGKNIFEG